jgi:beta-lactam-binding protein with PASTA domain
MGWDKVLNKGVKIVAEAMAPGMVDLGVKIGTEIYEQQKALIKIPDLKDVRIDEAMRILGDELHLIPTSAIANPNIAYADESDQEVMFSEPRFGSRVNPGTTVKVYYLTPEVIEKSKILLGTVIQEFKVPIVIGLNVYEAREDLEGLGLKVADKLEKPSIGFADKDDGQVTKLTYPNGQKVGSKLRTGERVWLYYVNEEIIAESKIIKENKEKEKQEVINRIKQVTEDVAKGTADTAQNLKKSIDQQVGKIIPKSKKDEGK